MPPAATSSSNTSDSPTVVDSPVLTTVNVPSFTTTTVTRGGVEPTVTSSSQPRSSNVPIPAIAGGTVAGVLLALVAVVGWSWWGRCIKRRHAKQRKEALAFLQVRENTRKNASTLSHPSTQYRPTILKQDPHGRKVTFVSSAPASSQSTLRDLKMQPSDSEKSTSAPPIPRPRPPTPPAHLAHTLKKPEAGLPPPLPRKNPQREWAPFPPLPASELPASESHRLVHQTSTLSSGSVYSTQSAIEDRQSGVPASLLQALTSEATRRSFLASYMPWNRNRSSIVSNNRLSEYSTGSWYSQYDDLAWESVGFAYGGEDEQPRP